MNMELLEAMHDDELRAVIARADALLKQHDRERKEKALEQATAILAAAGLSLKDVAGKARAPKPKPVTYRGGHNYQHPTKKELVWNAVGQKPNWLRELEAGGGKAVELPVAAAEIGAATAGRKAG